MPEPLRVRTGVMHDRDGWWVIQERDGVRHVYGRGDGTTPLANEIQAQALATELAKVTREAMAAEGVPVFDWPDGDAS